MIRRIYISTLLLLCVSLTANAQYTSRLGRFKVDEVKGCAPFTVTITTTNVITTGECTGTKPCLMDYQGNGTQQQNLFTFTYTTPGTYKLSVLYQSIGADDITITVDPNIKPAFEIYSCANSQVQIKITNKDYDQYGIDFGDGSPVIQIPSSNNQSQNHSYSAAGNYSISVKGKDLNAANNCNAEVLPFTAIATLPTPKINTLTTVDATSIKLDFTNQTNIFYKTEIAVNNSATFQQFQSAYGITTLSVPNIKTDDNYYCFRLNSFDPCVNANTYSIPVCSHNFDLSVESGVNKLSWQTGTTGITSVEIQRDGTAFNIIPGAPLSFPDFSIICKTNYCYKVINNYSNGGKSISLQKCGTAFTTASPTPITTVSSVISDAGVKLTWLQDPKFVPVEYYVYKTIGTGDFNFLETVDKSKKEYMDATYAAGSTACYRINYIDQCNNASPDGISVCPLQLTGSVDNKNVITLNWSKYTGWASGVANYSVQKFNKNGALLQTINVGTDTLYVDDATDLVNQIYLYKIVATAVGTGITSSTSNHIQLTKDPHLFAPNAFTPNNDKLNDGFNVFGQYIVKMEFSIFDRWGSLIYTTEKNEPWDGTLAGKAMPEATYVWIAKITDMAGQNFTQSGTVVLLKKK